MYITWPAVPSSKAEISVPTVFAVIKAFPAATEGVVSSAARVS